MALTARGIQQVTPGPNGLPGDKYAARKSARSLRSIYALLQREGEATGTDLLAGFVPVDTTPRPKQHAHYDSRAWWVDVGATAFAGLYGIDAPADPSDLGATWRFAGVDEAAFDDEWLVPIAEYRDDPRVRAELRLDTQGIEIHSSRREAVLELFDVIAESGEELTTSAELADRLRRSNVESSDFDALESTLADLPAIDRSVERPPEPSEISIESYADVLAAAETVEQDPTTVWRISPDADE